MQSLLLFVVALAVSPAEVSHAWSTTGTHDGNIDSLAACRLTDGSVRVFATAKEGHCIDIFDAATGRRITRHGSAGSNAGEFAYPNGIVAVRFPGETGKDQTLILVIERDNHRVQAFHPDTRKSAGIFGADRLHRPYGGAVSYRDGGVYLYVTDTQVPPAETVKVFELKLNGHTVTARHVRSFGVSKGPGFIEEAESVVVDDQHDRVLLCDEARRDVKVYTRDGRFAGRTFAKDRVEREPEGIVICDTPAGGFVILTDQQKDLSVWHLFDRETYEHLGAFTGRPTIANTDGICLLAEPFGPFKQGAFFAVHDDCAVRAYPLDTIIDLAQHQR